MARRSNKRTTAITNLQKRKSLKKSTSEKVYELLHEAILSHELPGGTPLIEAQLADEFGVSKTPIREALQKLAHAGLVDMEMSRGATVHTITQDEIRDIFELRVYLEPIALGQSAKSMSTADFDALDTILDEAGEALNKEDYQRLSQLNGEFHYRLVQKATNQILLVWLERLSDRRQLLSLTGWRRENRSRDEWGEHRAIVEALRQHNVSLAEKRLADHIQRFAEIVLRDDGTMSDHNQNE